MERIEAEKEAQEARTAQFVAQWKEEHAARCGTAAGYQRHRRAGELPCGQCQKAYREANRSAEARRRKKAQGEAATASEVMREQMADPTRMSCCGAPKDEPEPSKKYEQRHRQLKPKTPICGPARACVRLYSSGGRLSQSAQIDLERQSPDRADCCGAPYDYDGERTKRYSKRHNRYKTPVCRWARQSANGGRMPLVERMGCCDAPVDGGEPSQKYAWRHKRDGTVPCPPAKECRNSMDRKIYKARKCVDDVNQRRRERRSA